VSLDERDRSESITDRAGAPKPVTTSAEYDVSIIIVTYQCRDFIDTCITSIADAAKHVTVETIVVDNASIDGTASHVRRRWPDVTVIDTGWNSGFSRACNTGLRIASGRNVLFLNGDATMESGSIDALVGHIDEIDGPRIVAPRVCNLDGTDQGTARAFPTPAAALFGRRSPLSRIFPNNRSTRRYLVGRERTDEAAYEVDWVSGACLMIDRESLDKLDGLDERFFMYWEDADICKRVKVAGGSVWCIPSVRATHDEGSSASVISRRQNARFHRSAYCYAAKHMLVGPWRPLRPVARAALTARAGLVLATAALKRRAATRTTEAPDLESSAASSQLSPSQ
jgi:N-acetylglucosaminyl-diphospho-decaprenol L-rhamnosyltransferase